MSQSDWPRGWSDGNSTEPWPYISALEALNPETTKQASRQGVAAVAGLAVAGALLFWLCGSKDRP